MMDREIPGWQHAPSFWSVWVSPISEVRVLHRSGDFWDWLNSGFLPCIAAALLMCWETCWKYVRLICRSLAQVLGGTTLAVRSVLRQSGAECQACGMPPTRWRTVGACQLQQSSVYGSAQRTAGLTRLWRSICSTSLQCCLPLRQKAADVRSAVWLLPTCCLHLSCLLSLTLTLKDKAIHWKHTAGRQQQADFIEWELFHCW